MKKSKFLFSSLKRNSFSRLFKRKNDGSEKKIRAVNRKNSWSFVCFAHASDDSKREANLREHLKHFINNGNYSFSFNDVINTDMYGRYLDATGDFQQLFDEDFENFKKEKKEDFTLTVMTVLIERLEQQNNLEESEYVKQKISELPTVKEFLEKWNDAAKHVKDNLTPLPSELDTQKAHEFWKVLKEKGYIDANYQPIPNVKTKKAIIAHYFADYLDLNSSWGHSKYATFENFWHVDKLCNIYNSHSQDDSYKTFREEMSEIVKSIYKNRCKKNDLV